MLLHRVPSFQGRLFGLSIARAAVLHCCGLIRSVGIALRGSLRQAALRRRRSVRIGYRRLPIGSPGAARAAAVKIRAAAKVPIRPWAAIAKGEPAVFPACLAMPRRRGTACAAESGPGFPRARAADTGFCPPFRLSVCAGVLPSLLFARMRLKLVCRVPLIGGFIGHRIMLFCAHNSTYVNNIVIRIEACNAILALFFRIIAL